MGKRASFGPVCCISHKCTAIFYSSWHEEKRPSRAFAFALLAQNLLVFLGLYLYTWEFLNDDLASKGVVAYAVTFLVIRGLGNLYYWLLR